MSTTVEQLRREARADALRLDRAMNSHDKWLQAPYERAAIDHEALQAEIAAEAEARLIEWRDMDIAARDAHDYELLRDDLDFLIYETAKQIAVPEEDQLQAMAALGLYLAAKVRLAAQKVATHVCTEKVSS